MTSPRIMPLPAQAGDAGFACALQAELVARLVQTHLATEATLLDLSPDYLRWKQDDGSLVGYRASVRHAGGVHSTYVTARTAAPHRLAAEAERLQHRREESHAGLRAFTFLPAKNVLLVAFPIDRAMHDLRRLVRASKVRSLVAATCPEQVPAGRRISKSRSHCRLVRYKPERRAVLQWQIGLVDGAGRGAGSTPVWVRCHAEAQAQRTQTATTAAATAGVPCPRTLGIAHDRLLIESHVDGCTWAPFTGAANDGQLERIGAVVARLHGARCAGGLPQHTTLAELDLALRAVEDLARLDRQIARTARDLGDRLAREVPPTTPAALAHGDLHPGQVLVTADGAGLCDFDRACLAPPAFDLGTLLAHCLELDAAHAPDLIARFLAAYRRHRQLPLDLELRWWTSSVLLRNATRPFRRLQVDWPAATARILTEATHVLDGTGAEGPWR